MNLEKIIWWWQFECKEECTPESVTKLFWEVNISGSVQSIQVDEQSSKWIGS